VKSAYRRTLLLDLALVFLATAVLILPLFEAQYLERWDSIEGSFIADGRFLHAHWPHPQWQPLWYCGTRYDYMYPPVVRYGVALLAAVCTPVHAYHFLTAVLYCLGIAGVYLLARIMSGSRGAAWLAAAGSALVSPVFALLQWPRTNSLHHAPWRLWVLLRFGEGPHIAALGLLAFALAFAWLALNQRRAAALAAAAVFSALVALTNFYGATSLGLFYAALVWAAWITSRDHRVWLPAIAIPALAYGLAAFWLTPSDLRNTLNNLRWFLAEGRRWPAAVPLTALLLFMLLSWRIASGRPRHAYATFLAGGLFLFGFNILGYFYFHRFITGEPGRVLAELDLLIILASVEVLRHVWMWPARSRWQGYAARALAALLVLAALASARHYVRRAWSTDLYPPEPDYRQRVEYRLSQWIAGRAPQARTFVSGSNRLWWDTWQDLPQAGGAQDWGRMNPHLPDAEWNILAEPDPQAAVNWLTALGVDAVIVPLQRSQEMFHDFRYPHKFAGVLPVLYDDGEGNVIYQVPRRYNSLAHVVDRGRLAALPALQLGTTVRDALRAYTEVLEQGPNAPATITWQGTDQMRIHARLQAGQSLVVQESFDPAWHAYLGATALPVRADPLAFLIIDAPPGEHDIRLVFETPLENRLGWGVTGLSLLIVAVLAAYGK
jgi:hypothetical protein